ncbi:alpha/beta fold hydrolase [Brevibacterium yomogidense]|uniref:alpha/beta fold hydrolase n=1 Tax=Brevibacterium yomogidense TaxID=946573 RepID=UPI002FCD165F
MDETMHSALWNYTHIQLTTADTPIGVSSKDVVWTYRKTTLFRYRSTQRKHPVPILLTFALINRPDIFDLRPGNSFVEFLLEEGYDVFLVDWGYADEEDADTGLDDYVMEYIPRAIREVRRASGAREISLIGWCIGAALTGMYLALNPDAPVRNWVPLTMPYDVTGSTYETLLNTEALDLDWLEDRASYLPGVYVDTVNKMLKPVPNFLGTPWRLYTSVEDGTADKTAYQSMAKWVADNPNFPMRAFRQWVTWMYRENRLARGRMRLRGRKVDLAKIQQSILVVTASKDHIAPRDGTLPVFDVLTSPDTEHLDGVGGHIGLMAGSRARGTIWPRINDWLEPRSQHDRPE